MESSGGDKEGTVAACWRQWRLARDGDGLLMKLAWAFQRQ